MRVHYIKTGVTHIEVPKNIQDGGIEAIKQYLESQLEIIPVSQLEIGLKEYIGLGFETNIFDETPNIECIEDDDYNILHQTNVWHEITCTDKEEKKKTPVNDKPNILNVLKNS